MKKLRNLVQEAREALAEDGLPIGTIHTWTDGRDYQKTREGWVEVPSHHAPKHAAPEPSPHGAKQPPPESHNSAKAKAPEPPEKHKEEPKKKYAKPSGVSSKKVYNVDPTKDADGDGVADASRVGVPGDAVLPPPPIPRLPNLTPEERELEDEFATDFEKHTEAMTKGFYEIAQKNNWVFETDGAKALNAEWTRPDLPPENKGEPLHPERAKTRALFNTAFHQTANAIAKRAFLKRLDDIAKLPEEQRKVLVTCGGVAAGKGTALAADPTLAASAAATWDAAGEQNSTENPWLLEECVRRGIKPTFLYVHNDPERTWPGAVARAKSIGRMVDARVFADSYVEGAKNFKAFHDKYKDKVSFVIAKAGKPPTFLDDVPPESLKMNSDEVYNKALDYLDKNKADIPEHIYKGAVAGKRIWSKKP